MVGAVKVKALRQDTADFGVVRFICRLCGIESIYKTVSINIVKDLIRLTKVVGPLELHRNILIAAVVRLDGFNHGHGGNVLDKHHRARDGEVSWMIDDDGVDEHPRGCDPDIVSTTSAGNLSSG